MDGQGATMVQIPPAASHASVFVTPLALREQAFGLEVNIFTFNLCDSQQSIVFVKLLHTCFFLGWVL